MRLYKIIIIVKLGLVVSLIINHTALANIAEEDIEKLLYKGFDYVRAGKAEVGISQYLNLVINHFEKKYPNSEGQVYCARSQREKVYYYSLGQPNRKKVVVIKGVWADALYMKAYGLIELKRISEAIITLKKVLKRSPMNSQYLSELGSIHQSKQQWRKALYIYKLAEKAADFSLDKQRNYDLRRAKRGIGFVYVEQGRLEDAVTKYRQCLHLDPNDRKAKIGLSHVIRLRAKLLLQ